MHPLAAWSAGMLVGAVAGLVPGLHANTLVTLLLAAALPDPVLLAAMAASHAMLAILPSTFLGVPAESGHLGMLPAHRLLLSGQAREAVRASAHATLGASLLTILLLLPFKWLWLEPVALGRFLPPLLPVALVAAPLWLAWRERRKGWSACLWGLACFGLAGALGLLARRPATALLPIPASGLGALLSGLFGGAGLLSAGMGSRLLPEQAAPGRAPRRTRRRMAVATVGGVVASAATALVPGATPALVASLTPRAGDARSALAGLSAVGAAQPLLAVALLWLNGQARSGLAIGIGASQAIEPWASGRAPSLLLAVLAAWLAGSVAGLALLRGLEEPVSRWLPRLPQRRLAIGALLLLAATALAVAGGTGLLLFAAGTLTGLVPLAAGVRRVHLIGALLVPALLAR